MAEQSDQSLSDDEEFEGLDNEIQAFNNGETDETSQGLPEKSEKTYLTTYNTFMTWRKENNIDDFSESTFVKYIKEVSTIRKPNTLWSIYSMLNKVLKLKHQVILRNYPLVHKVMKELSKGYKPQRKQQLFTMEEVAKFMKTAPNQDYLLAKVAVLFVLHGRCRRFNDLININESDVKKIGNEYCVRFEQKDFRINAAHTEMIDKYIELRSKTFNPHDRFFLHYKNNKCINQPVGKNQFSSIPQRIAQFLKLPNSESYFSTALSLCTSVYRKTSGPDETFRALKIYDKNTLQVSNESLEKVSLSVPSTSPRALNVVPAATTTNIVVQQQQPTTYFLVTTNNVGTPASSNPRSLLLQPPKVVSSKPDQDYTVSNQLRPIRPKNGMVNSTQSAEMTVGLNEATEDQASTSDSTNDVESNELQADDAPFETKFLSKDYKFDEEEISISDEESDGYESSSEILEMIEASQYEEIPVKSKAAYLAIYNYFIKWRRGSNLQDFSEDVFIAFIKHLEVTKKASTVLSKYSMLRTVVLARLNIDIKHYPALTAYLKELAKGITPKPSKFFSAEEINNFLEKAPNEQYLAIKIAMLFGVYGGFSNNDLVTITVDQVKKKGNVFLVASPSKVLNTLRSFIINAQYSPLVENYLQLRPFQANLNRFFIKYREGKCARQAIGKNAFSKLPYRVAKFLNLPNPSEYTGHCFRTTYKTLGIGTNVKELQPHGSPALGTKRLGTYPTGPLPTSVSSSTESNSDLTQNSSKKRRLDDEEIPGLEQSSSESIGNGGQRSCNCSASQELQTLKECTVELAKTVEKLAGYTKKAFGRQDLLIQGLDRNIKRLLEHAGLNDVKVEAPDLSKVKVEIPEPSPGEIEEVPRIAVRTDLAR